MNWYQKEKGFCLLRAYPFNNKKKKKKNYFNSITVLPLAEIWAMV
jgi:hypothetical protein